MADTNIPTAPWEGGASDGSAVTAPWETPMAKAMVKPLAKAPEMYGPRQFVNDFTSPQNWAKNGKQFMDGIGVMGSAVMARGHDILPNNLISHPLETMADRQAKPFNQFQRLTSGDPRQAADALFGGDPITGSKPAFRVFGNENDPSDISTLGKFGVDMAQHYMQYGSALRNDEQGIAARKDIASNPGFTVMDALPAVGPAKGLAGGVVKTVAPYVPQGIKDIGTAANIAGDVIKGAAGEQALRLPGVSHIANGISNIVKSAKQWNEITSIMTRHDKAFRSQLAEQLKWVKEAYDQIPHHLISDEDLTKIVTIGDENLYRSMLGQPHAPAVIEFQRRLNSVNDWVGEKLIKAGIMTPEEAQIAKYGDYVMGELRHSHNNPSLRYDQVHDLGAHVDSAAQDLNVLGDDPAYIGIVTKKQSAAIRGRLSRPFGGMSKTPKDPNARPGFATPREQGFRDPNVHEMNPYRAFETRMIQELGFIEVRNAIEEMLKSKVLQGQGQPFPLKAYLDRAAQGAGLGAPVWSKMLHGIPESIELPKNVAAELSRVLDEPGFWGRFWEAPNNIFKRWTLGLDFAWAGLQTLQNGLISGYANFKGPEDFGRSLIAYAMAFDKRSDAIAKNWIYHGHGEYIVPPMATTMAKLGAPVQAWMNAVYKVATEGDNYFRVVQGLKSLMKQIEDAEPASRIPMRKAFDLTARFDQVERAATNANYAANATKEIFNWFYDYGPEMAQKWRLARGAAPFFLWWMHSIRLVSTAAIETPFKNAVLKELAKYAPPNFQQGVDDQHKRMGMVPLYDREGQPRQGPNKGQLMMGRSGFLPLMQPFELVEQGFQMAQEHQKTAESAGLPPLNPIIGYIIGLAGKNVQNMSDWSDPSLIQGKYLPEPDEEGYPIEVKSRPVDALNGFRALLPRQEAMFRNMMSGKYVPSDFAHLFDGSAKRGSDDQKLLNFTPLEQAFHTIMKTKPTEVTRTQDDMDVMREAARKKFEKIKNRYQSERGEHVPSTVEMILKGLVLNNGH